MIADQDKYGPDDWAGVVEFSPDSRLLTFGARFENQDRIMVNGQPGKGYDALYRLKFDSPDKFHFAARQGSEILVVDETIELG